MEDSQIVELYWQRSETAIEQTQRKYEPYCFGIAMNILARHEDAQECVNDTYLAAWNSMPPHRPSKLSSFLGKLTRRIAIDCWRGRSAAKRGGGTITYALEELEDCLPNNADPAASVEAKELAMAVSAFLRKTEYQQRRVFLMRYFEMCSLDTICNVCGISMSTAKSMLHRTRRKLRVYLEKEGFQ